MDTIEVITSTEYLQLLEELKTKVKNSKFQAALSVNKELITLYFEIGQSLLERQQKYNWGGKFIENVAIDLRKEFPDMQGLLERNIQYMRQFADKFKDLTIGQRNAGQITQRCAAQLQIPWRHHQLMLDKKLSSEIHLWYSQKSLDNGWSRDVLAIQIETDLYGRQAGGTQINNFKKALASPQSDLARDILKDPYILSFIDEGKDEREVEHSLIQHIQKFLLELGKGFAFLGSQYKIEVGGEDFAIDLLFYHVKLKCYVALELKVGKFKPEYAGKMQFYLTALDMQVKDEADNSSIGIILCKEKNKIIAEYALHGMSSPMGITNYEVGRKLPENLKNSLPSLEEIEKELAG